MKFNVNVVKNTEHLTWVYDTENNHVYDEHGELVNPAVIENGFNLGEAYTETSNPNKKKLDSLRLFEVLLGFNCNFNCEYCGQKDYVDVVPSASPKDVLQFVEKIKSLNIPAPGRVAFWGGEPLVYWKVLEVLIPALRELWPTSYSNIITNGSLLTKEKIDFLKKYQIAMTVSYDCVDDTHRLVNIGKDSEIVECLKYAHKVLDEDFDIWVTVSPKHADIPALTEHIHKLLGTSERVKICFYPLKCKTPADLFTERESKGIEDHTFRIINEQDPEGYYGAIEYTFDMFMHRLLSHAPIDNASSHCQFPYSNGLLISMDGRLWNCHIRPTEIGHIDQVAEGEEVVATNIHHWTHYDYCAKCPWIHICGGNCHTMNPQRHLLTCQNFRSFYTGIFKGVFAKLFGVYVESVDYELPKAKVIPIKSEQ